jgi:hypothetical protein
VGRCVRAWVGYLLRVHRDGPDATAVYGPAGMPCAARFQRTGRAVLAHPGKFCACPRRP